MTSSLELSPIDRGRAEELARLRNTTLDQVVRDAIAAALAFEREVAAGGNILVRRADRSVWEAKLR